MKKYLSEFIGTFLLVAVVIGSGIMGETLSNGNNAVALLGNTIATGAILFVIIKMFANISGAHFNPIVSLIFLLRREIDAKNFTLYLFMQFFGGICAVFIIHYIFELEHMLQISSNIRGELPLLISEIIATFGLILTILLIRKYDEKSVAIGVALFISAGYWFTSSTSFANPAVTFARVFTNTFTGIAPVSVKFFLIGQLIGGLIAHYVYKLLEE